MELKDKVIAEIKKIYDPEIPVNIYDLGLIYDVKVDKENIVEIICGRSTVVYLKLRSGESKIQKR